MKTIHKYSLDSFYENIDMPEGAVFMHFAMQRGRACIWAEVDTSKKLLPYRIHIAATGHDLGSGVRHYIGTAMDDPYVWHAYLVTGEQE